MQWHARAADLFDQRFALGLKLVEIRRANRLVCSTRENQVRDLEIAHWAIVRRR
jgi:hypothetical protein